jgi:Icc-related predicted phosphoesterase
MPNPKSSSHIRFAAVGDIHVHKDSAGTLHGFFAQAADEADALLLCGDLTDYGTAQEAKALAGELGALPIPVVAVLGNHDYESGTPELVIEALVQAGVRVLDGSACEIEGVGIAGVKGFGGGFGRGSLGAWGEPATKLFVQEALNEAMKLESALAKLRTRRRIALLHYSPVVGTVQGRAGGNLPLPGQQPVGGAAVALSDGCGVPRPRAPRHAAGAHHERCTGLQRRQTPAAAQPARHAALFPVRVAS